MRESIREVSTRIVLPRRSLVDAAGSCSRQTEVLETVLEEIANRARFESRTGETFCDTLTLLFLDLGENALRLFLRTAPDDHTAIVLDHRAAVFRILDSHVELSW